MSWCQAQHSHQHAAMWGQPHFGSLIIITTTIIIVTRTGIQTY